MPLRSFENGRQASGVSTRALPCAATALAIAAAIRRSAVALSMLFGPAAGLELIDTLAAEPALKGYHLLPSVRGDIRMALGRFVQLIDRLSGVKESRNVSEVLEGIIEETAYRQYLQQHDRRVYVTGKNYVFVTAVPA